MGGQFLRSATGNVVTLSLVNLPAGTVLAFGCIGQSNTTFTSYVLPYPLSGHGMPGCWLVQDSSITGGTPFQIASGAATRSALVPNHASHIGLQIFTQCWTIAPSMVTASQPRQLAGRGDR